MRALDPRSDPELERVLQDIELDLTASERGARLEALVSDLQSRSSVTGGPTMEEERIGDAARAVSARAYRLSKAAR